VCSKPLHGTARPPALGTIQHGHRHGARRHSSSGLRRATLCRPARALHWPYSSPLGQQCQLPTAAAPQREGFRPMAGAQNAVAHAGALSRNMQPDGCAGFREKTLAAELHRCCCCGLRPAGLVADSKASVGHSHCLLTLLFSSTVARLRRSCPASVRASTRAQSVRVLSVHICAAADSTHQTNLCLCGTRQPLGRQAGGLTRGACPVPHSWSRLNSCFVCPHAQDFFDARNTRSQACMFPRQLRAVKGFLCDTSAGHKRCYSSMYVV
jgi:hypothetical protein